MDMSQYRDLFVSEARGHIQGFNELIVRLEDDGADQEAVDELFRHAHSLKGMAASMQYQAIAALAHRMEDLLSRVRSRETVFVASLADLLLEGSDVLAAMVSAVEAGDGEMPDCSALMELLAGYGSDSAPPPLQAAETGAAERGTTGRNPETLSRERLSRHSDTFRSIRVRTETLDRLVNITGELITTRYRLADRVQNLEKAQLDEPLNRLSTLLRELRDEVFQARMLPFSFVANRFPRLVRDLSRTQGKEILFQVEGKEIELDRGILEEISEPLAHILRNAIDHGIETAEQRIAAGKPASGTVRIDVTRDKEYVTIIVTDDGRGMDPERLAVTAVRKGVISREQADALTRHEALLLVCAPGFSTAEAVSDISGRGVGMDAVMVAVHAMGGVLAIESESGLGSRFLLKLPVSVSIIHALLVESGSVMIAFPVNAVKRTIEIERGDITEDGGESFLTLDSERIHLRNLRCLLGQPPAPGTGNLLQAVIVEAGGVIAGVVVDRLLGQREIFVKPLGTPLNRIKGLTGGTITGDGRIVYVVDAGALW